MPATSVFEGLARERGAAVLDRVVPINDEHHPEWQGSNIYGLVSFVTADGVSHLLGTVSKAAKIMDFTTGRVVYDFSAFGAAPRAGGDSYGAVAVWRGRLYFGGWVITPSPAGAALNTADKYTYLISTADLDSWTVHLSDKATSATAWQAEISDLIPTNGALLILRGDTAGGGTGSGVHSFNGTTITALTAEAAIKGSLQQDTLWYAVRNSASIHYRNVDAAGNGTLDLSARATRVGGTKGLDGTWQGAIGTHSGYVFVGTSDGFFLIQQDTNNPIFVPCALSPVTGQSRAIGWRSQVVSVAGGLVVAANWCDPTKVDTTTGFQSLLLWIGPAGQVKVLDTGAAFGGIAVHDGRLYYGVAPAPHGNNFTNHQVGNPSLQSVPLSDLKRLTLPFQERIYRPAGINSVFGGYPTLGYSAGRAVLTSSAAGTLTVWDWTSEYDKRALGTVTFTLGQTQSIDLAPYMTGGMLGFSFDVASNIDGSIALS